MREEEKIYVSADVRWAHVEDRFRLSITNEFGSTSNTRWMSLQEITQLREGLTQSIDWAIEKATKGE